MPDILSLDTGALRRAFLRSLARGAQPGLIFDSAGTETGRNEAFRRILESEPRPDLVMARLRELAEQAVASYSPAREPVDFTDDEPQPSYADFSVAANRYRARIIVMEPGVLGPAAAIVLSVECLLLGAPSVADLLGRFGLTERQAEVALLLARGLSNKAIAGELAISLHTARNHTRNTLRKMGANRRGEVAALMNGLATGIKPE